MSATDYVKLVAELGMTGLVGWIVLYLVRTGLPKMIESFQAELTAQRTSYCSEMGEERKLTREIQTTIVGEIRDVLRAVQRVSEQMTMLLSIMRAHAHEDPGMLHLEGIEDGANRQPSPKPARPGRTGKRVAESAAQSGISGGTSQSRQKGAGDPDNAETCEGSTT